MFTGIIEETGLIERVQNGRHSAVLHVQAQYILNDINIGDSVAVNGVCLTVTAFHKTGFTADIMHETLNRSGFAKLNAGSSVNLERAMSATGRFNGHIVTGHVDSTGKILRIRKDDNAIWYTVQADKTVMKYIVEKGSIAIDGISLTVAEVTADNFSVSVIPHTVRATALKEWYMGNVVNLETDIIGKYVQTFFSPQPDVKSEDNITQDYLSRYGY